LEKLNSKDDCIIFRMVVYFEVYIGVVGKFGNTYHTGHQKILKLALAE